MAASILSLVLLIYWIMKVEVVSIYSPIISVSALESRSFKYGMTVLAIASIMLMLLDLFPEVEFSRFSNLSANAYLLAGVSAFLTMLVLIQISKFSSVIYAFISSLVGIESYLGGSVDIKFAASTFASWFAAPLLAMILGALIFVIYKNSIGKLHTHLFQKISVLRFLVLLGAILITVALAINNGSLLLLIGGSSQKSFSFAIVAVIIILVQLCMGRRIMLNIYREAEMEFEVSFPVAISIIFSSAIVLILFSFSKLPGAIGLQATPLSASSLIFGSFAGIGLLLRREVVETGHIFKNLLSVVLAPIISMIISYLLCMVVSTDLLSILPSAVNPVADMNLNYFMFIGIGVLGLIIMLIVAYQDKMKSNVHDNSFLQQQMMYDNQNELKALEMKSVLAENRSLYNKLEEKRKELINVALNINEQKEFVEDLYERITEASQTKDAELKDKELDEIKQYLFQRMSFSNEMDGFYAQAEILHKDFSHKLKEKFPNLTEQEKKLATLLRLGFSTKEISTLMNISPKSGEISRYRLRKKLNLSREDNLIRFIKSL